MKLLLTSTLAVILAATGAFAEESHDHDKAIPGPKGGRIVEIAGGHAEFFVQPDRKVSVTLYGEDMKPLTPAGQIIAAIAEAPSGKAKLEFDKTEDAFVSTTALPDGDGYRIVLQIKASPESKTQNFRIDYRAEVCGKCKKPEYACTCSH